MRVEKKNLKELNYIIRYPEGYRDGDRCPVIFMLHGAGSRGSDLGHLLTNVYFSVTARHERFPFITVAPQCSENTWFDMFHLVKELLRECSVAEYADPERIYLMGASMGGYAAWQLAMSMPEYIAAMVPICGGGMYWNAARLANVPIWAHHGALDETVRLEESEKMVNAVNEAGGNARLTVYPDTKHNAWTPAYSNYEVFEWLLSHKNENVKVLADEYTSVAKFG